MAARLPRLAGVIGAGQMGRGIAQLLISHGIPVALTDTSASALASAPATIEANLSGAVRKGKMSQADARAAMSRLSTSPDIGCMSGADFVVEAAVEDEGVKRRILAALDGVAPPGAVLASNTSSISLTRLAAATRRPDKVIGMHFMNPPPVMKLIEIIRGEGTSQETFEATRDLCRHLGKTPCVSADRPGFIVNRVLMPMINEAFFALMEGVATAEDIDVGMRVGTNQPLGPLALADFIGLDTVLSIMRVIHEGLGEDKYRPCPLLVEYVEAGRLGKKTGRGVHVYEG